MKKNSKISVALHAVLHMSLRGQKMTSEELAECLETNPVVVRRILGELKKAQIVDSEKGHGGGWVLVKNIKSLSFYDIFKSLNETLIPDSIDLKDDNCLVMRTISNVMDEFLEEAQILLNKKLQKIKFSHLQESVVEHVRTDE